MPMLAFTLIFSFSTMPEAALVQRVFGSISRRYDLANRVISGGMDIVWRKKVVRRVVAKSPSVVVDLATGSGDLAFELRRRLPSSTTVTGLDFCEPMLDEARKKQKGRAWAGNIEFAFGDILNLQLRDNSVDVITIAWGLRNLEDRSRGLREILRVLRPGGSMFCLEFSQPYRLIRKPYYFYMNNLLPYAARAVTGDKGAYDYLAGTVSQFPGRHQLSEEMLRCGFAKVHATPLLGSIVAIHEAQKAR